jgi:trehalose 6-phosphate phosphatase
LVDAHPGTLLEDKDRTVGLHFRLAPQFEPVLREAVIEIAKPLGSNYHIQGGKMLLEIKPRGFSKATAIQAFMKESPFSGRRPVFVGDDLTDQDGFGMVEAHGGISVGVGDLVQGQFYLPDVTAVRDWLRRIADLHDSHHA